MFLFYVLYSSSPWLYVIFSHFSQDPTLILHPSPAAHFKMFQAFLIKFSKCAIFSTMHSCFERSASLVVFLKLKCSLLPERFFFLLNAAFVMAMLDSNSVVHHYLISCYPHCWNILYSPGVSSLLSVMVTGFLHILLVLFEIFQVLPTVKWLFKGGSTLAISSVILN